MEFVTLSLIVEIGAIEHDLHVPHFLDDVNHVHILLESFLRHIVELVSFAQIWTAAIATYTSEESNETVIKPFATRYSYDIVELDLLINIFWNIYWRFFFFFAFFISQF